MSALVIRWPKRSWLASVVTGIIFGLVAVAVLEVARQTEISQKLPVDITPWLPFAAGAALFVIVALVVRFQIQRWQAALLVGFFGGLLATGGSNPAAAQTDYSNFLLILSYWISPWVAVMLIDWFFKHHGQYDLRQLYDPDSRFRAGMIAWIVGLVVSIPFWNQTWYVGPIPTNYPQVGDLSYFVGFAVAAIVYFILGRPVASVRTAEAVVGVGEEVTEG